MKEIKTDFLVIGAGVIGLTLAWNLRKVFPQKEVYIIEKMPELGFHSSGRNSGVLHAGFYYTPDSLKAKFTRQGCKEMTDYCELKGLKINKCGKVVVAKSEEELNTLIELKTRGDKNGVELYLINEQELDSIDSNAKTYKYALWSPKTAVVNPKEVLNTIKQDLIQEGVKILYNTPYRKNIENKVYSNDYVFEAEKIINVAGLYADRIAKDFGFSNDYVIVPFKGIYIEYTGTEKFIKTNIYPVPNIKNPFLGVHFTIKVDGTIKIGPTAIPCFWRENYKGFENFSLSEFLEIGLWESKLFFKKPDFRTLAFEEIKKYKKNYMLNEASKLVKSFPHEGFNKWGTPGIRAQLLNVKTLQLVSDFVVEGDKNSLHILNAVSPAFTASFPFTRYVVENYIKT